MNVPSPIPISTTEALPQHIKQFANENQLTFRPVSNEDVFSLDIQDGKLVLQKMDEPQLGVVCVDFLSGGNQYRRKFGGGKEEAIAKAVGVKKGRKPFVLDATAGLGRDAFVLACVSCRVHMLERNPFVALLLADGLERVKADEEIGVWISERLTLELTNSFSLSTLEEQPDVIYLDPMFPDKKKKALVKKEMRVFQELLGADEDTDQLLKWALETAQKKVVVKRPLKAPILPGTAPNTDLKTKKHRFDIYIK